MTAARVYAFPSQQQEEINNRHDHRGDVATWNDAYAWAKTAPKKVKRCRMKMRHDFPALVDDLAENPDFDGVTEDGYLYRTHLCGSCRMAVRVDLWYPMPQSDGSARWEPYASLPLQYVEDEDGNTYLMDAGYGRLTSKLLKSVEMTMAMEHRTVADIKAAAQARQAAKGKANGG